MPACNGPAATWPDRPRGAGMTPRLRNLPLALALLALLALPAKADSFDRTLEGGWYLWDPYQYVQEEGGIAFLTGLDVELMRAIANEAGYRIEQHPVPWRQHVEDLRTGVRDIASGATRTAQRERFATFSKPYREETNVLYLPASKASGYAFGNVGEMLRIFEADKFRLGIVAGYAYADPKINAFIADPAHAPLLAPAANDRENFIKLMDGRIDGFLADQLVGATTAWRGGWISEVAALPLGNPVPIHLMFSKASVPDETVAAFNAAIDHIVGTGIRRSIFQTYLFPLMIEQTLDTRWFLLLDIVGTIAFAVSGVLIASREGYSFVGALVLAALPAVGGGTVRDLLLDRDPIGVMRTPLYLVLVLATVLAGLVVTWALARLRQPEPPAWLARTLDLVTWQDMHRSLLAISDALGLAAFTVIGVAVTVGTDAQPLWLWGPIMAMVTGAGGGILRDIVRQRGDIAVLKTEFYAEVALAWGLVLSVYLLWHIPSFRPNELLPVVVVVVAGAFVARMAAVHFRLQSPLFSRLATRDAAPSVTRQTRDPS